MARFVVWMLAILFACTSFVEATEKKAKAPNTSQEVLIAKPPKYRQGESYTGVFYLKDGTQFAYYQEAQRIQKKTLILSGVFAGMMQIDVLVVDADTLMPVLSGEEAKVIKILSSDCSVKKLYPVSLNKIYECSVVHSVHNKRLESTSRFHFDRVDRDKKKIKQVCAIVDEKDQKAQIKSRVCMTPDGKWVTEMRQLEVTEFEDS
jgi:hypothetical protein